MGRQSRIPLCRLVAVALIFVPALVMAQNAGPLPTRATSVPILLPGGVAYDVSGDLFIAETGRHVIRRVSAGGVLSTVAGSGVQGFGGDGGPASAALLDSPAAVALDSAGNLYLADSHNHRVRRVDAGTGTITSVAQYLGTPVALAVGTGGTNVYVADATAHQIVQVEVLTGKMKVIAGDGSEGFSGDGGPAVSASLDSPRGLAVDAKGNLLLADSHNHRVRRVVLDPSDVAYGRIETLAGTGSPKYAGDLGAAVASALALPEGLAVDTAGNILVADSANHRVRRIDAVTHEITTIAGNGIEGFGGDQHAAVTASLDRPTALALSPDQLAAVSDTGDQRVRQIDAAANLQTVAGLGLTTTAALVLSSPSVLAYGSGNITATLRASPATGAITFFDTSAGTTQTVGSVALAENLANLSLSSMNAGIHRIYATYSGDGTHDPAQSNVISLVISPAPVMVTADAVTLLYGQNVPPLSGNVAGVLPRDQASVSLGFTTSAAPFSHPGTYPITGALTGVAAGNYVVTNAPVFVTISPAPSLVSLSNSLRVTARSSTSGTPAGQVNLLDGSTIVQGASLSATGDASFSAAGLSLGSHTLTAAYAGNRDFLPSNSAPQLITVGPTTSPDFSLAATGQTIVVVPAGTDASFSFATAPLNGTLASPIILNAAGLPPGATASFNPAYLPPTNAPAAFILTITTAKTAMLDRPRGSGSVDAAHVLWSPSLLGASLLPLLLGRGKRRVRLLLAGAASILLAGCGARIYTAGNNAATSRSYLITVSATATSSGGTPLVHTASVTLTLQ